MIRKEFHYSKEENCDPNFNLSRKLKNLISRLKLVLQAPLLGYRVIDNYLNGILLLTTGLRPNAKENAERNEIYNPCKNTLRIVTSLWNWVFLAHQTAAENSQIKV